MPPDELEKFKTSLDVIDVELKIKLKAKHVGDRNSKENHDIVVLQIQKRVLEKKIARIENGEDVIDVSPEVPEKEEKPLEQKIECEGEHCNNPTNDPSRLCAICKSKKDNPSKIGHG